jgi:hypothetical protein
MNGMIKKTELRDIALDWIKQLPRGRFLDRQISTDFSNTTTKHRSNIAEMLGRNQDIKMMRATAFGLLTTRV